MKIKRLVLGVLKTNCYIVYDDEIKQAAVFDPADEGIKIKAELKKLSLQLKYIVITHAHYDHIAALDFLKDSFPEIKICIGKHEANSLNDDYLCLSVHFGQKAPISKADVLIADGDYLKLGNERLDFLHTPGHTKGGICAIANDFIISGDTLFLESVGRCDLPGGNTNQITSSIKDKLFKLPETMAVYPGHGDRTSIGHEKRNNPYLI